MSHPQPEQIIGHHIGTFFIPRWMIDQHGEKLIEFFAEQKILPVRAEGLFYRDGVEYTAYGVNFEAVPLGRIPYHYVLDCTLENIQDTEDPFKHSTIINEMSLRRFN